MYSTFLLCVYTKTSTLPKRIITVTKINRVTCSILTLYRFSTSSASSQGISTLVTEVVDPFQPAIVNMMLNKAGGSEHITLIEGEAPDVMSGCVLMLEGVEYVCVSVDSETGTTKHCTLRQGNMALKTLKVQTHTLSSCM